MKNFSTLALACAVAISATGSPRDVSTLSPKTRLTLKTEKSILENRVAEKAPKVTKVGQHIKLDKTTATSKSLNVVKKSPKKAEAQTETYFDETFACLKNGSEEEPVLITLDDDHNIPEDIIGAENYGFGGNALYEAGGALYVAFADEEGFGWTPDVPEGNIYTVSMDIKIAANTANSDRFDVLLCDYGSDYATDSARNDISQEWATYTFVLDATSQAYYGVFYFQFYAYNSADVMIKNFKITAEAPPVAAPVALPYTDFTGTSFTANWEPVENATLYLLTVAQYDYDNDTFYEPYVLEQEPVEGTSYVVSDIEPGGIYYYGVQATDGEYVSSMSSLIEVAALVVPTNISGSVATDAITVKWDGVPGANYYSVEVQEKYTAKGNETFTLANADFSSIVSEGTPDFPEEAEYLTEEAEQLPGWTFTLPAYINGGMGFVDFWIYQLFGYYASLDSGIYDFTDMKGATIDFDVTACSGLGSRLFAGLYALDSETGRYMIADSFTSEPLTADFTNVKFALATKEAPCIVSIMGASDDEEVDPNLFFGKFKATVDMEAGQKVGIPFVSDVTEDTSITFECTPKTDAEYSACVTAYNVDMEYGNAIASSAPSEYVALTGGSGVEKVSIQNDNAPVRYYNLQGVEVANPHGGVFIRVSGDNATKVAR